MRCQVIPLIDAIAAQALSQQLLASSRSPERFQGNRRDPAPRCISTKLTTDAGAAAIHPDEREWGELAPRRSRNGLQPATTRRRTTRTPSVIGFLMTFCPPFQGPHRRPRNLPRRGGLGREPYSRVLGRPIHVHGRPKNDPPH